MDDEKIQYDESDVYLTCTISDHTSSINQESYAIILAMHNLQTDDVNDPSHILISGDMNQQGIVDSNIY